MNDDTQRTCEIYQKAVASGVDPRAIVGELASKYGVQRPAIWRRLRAGGIATIHKCAGNRAAAGIRRERKDFKVAPLIVPRDPCPRCGVRRDIGCGHSLERLGMVL